MHVLRLIVALWLLGARVAAQPIASGPRLLVQDDGTNQCRAATVNFGANLTATCTGTTANIVGAAGGGGGCADVYATITGDDLVQAVASGCIDDLDLLGSTDGIDVGCENVAPDSCTVSFDASELPANDIACTAIAEGAGTDLCVDLEEEGQLGATVVTGTAAVGQYVRGTGADAATWATIPDGDLPATITRDSEVPSLETDPGVPLLALADYGDVCAAGETVRRNATDTGNECVAAGGLTGSGAASRLALWTGTQTLSFDDDFQWTATALGLGVSPLGGVRLHVQSPDDVTTPVFLDVYNDLSTTGVQIVSRRARGTSAVPSAVQAGDFLSQVIGRGYGATGFAAGARAAIGLLAAEAWTDTAQGTQIDFRTTTTGTTTMLERLRLTANGELLLGTTASVAGERLRVIGGDIATDNQVVSTIATGTAPLVVASTTEVANLRAATATALAANGADCSAGNYPLGVDAAGAAESCTADDDVPEAGDYTNLTGGAGIVHTPTGTIATASSETDFLASGALTCGAGTRGRMHVHTTPLQYCDNAATPTLQYAAYGTSGGAATDLACAASPCVSDAEQAAQALAGDCTGTTAACVVSNTTCTATDTYLDGLGNCDALNATTWIDEGQTAGGDLTGTYPNPTVGLNAVALSTDTTGNYVGTVAAGIGIAITGADGEDATKTVAFDVSDAGADPALAAGECRFSNEGASAAGWVCEGETADTIEARFRVVDPVTTDPVISFPGTRNTNTVEPKTCSGTDKVSAIAADGLVTCTTDQTAAGGGISVVQEDDVTVDGAATTLDFTEPDGTTVTSSPAGEANVNLARYALLGGRAGGQTLIGGTALGDGLTLTSTAHATKGPMTLSEHTGATVTSGSLTSGGTVLGVDATGTITGPLFGIELHPAGVTIGANGGIEPIRFDSTVTYTAAPSGFGHTFGPGLVPVFKNANGTAVTTGGITGYTANPTHRADGAAFTLTDDGSITPAVGGLVFRPFFDVINAGTGTAENVYGLLTQPSVGTGWTVTDVAAVRCLDPTGSGAITNNACIDIADLTRGTDDMTIRSAGAATMRHSGSAIFGATTAPVGRLDVTAPSSTDFTLARFNLSGSVTSANTGLAIGQDGVSVGAGGSLNLVLGTGTLTMTATPGGLGLGNFFSHSNTIKNATSTAITTSGMSSFVANPTITADTAALTLNNGVLIPAALASFVSSPTFNRTGTPNSTAADVTGFLMSGGLIADVGAGWTITNYRGVHVQEPGGSGTITNLVGVDIDALAQGGTNISLRSSGANATMRHAGTVRIGATTAAVDQLEVVGGASVDTLHVGDDTDGTHEGTGFLNWTPVAAGTCAVGEYWCQASTATTTLRCCENGTSFAMNSASGSGDNLSVNGSTVVDADLDDATPAAPPGATNVKWQQDGASPANISAYVPMVTTDRRVLCGQPRNAANGTSTVNTTCSTVWQPEGHAVGCTIETGAAVANLSNGNGSWARCTTGTSSGNGCSFQSTGAITRRDGDGILWARVTAPATLTSTRVWIGLFDEAVTAVTVIDSDDPASADLAAFRYSTNVPDPTTCGAGTDPCWMAVVKDGTTVSAVNTTVGITANAVYRLRIELGASEVRFYINDALVRTATTNLPGTDQYLRYQVGANTLNTTTKAILVGRTCVVSY